MATPHTTSEDSTDSSHHHCTLERLLGHSLCGGLASCYALCRDTVMTPMSGRAILIRISSMKGRVALDGEGPGVQGRPVSRGPTPTTWWECLDVSDDDWEAAVDLCRATAAAGCSEVLELARILSAYGAACGWQVWELVQTGVPEEWAAAHCHH